jgi:cleavage stimulation factor subunit 2
MEMSNHTKLVYLGDIPYDITEEQVTELARSIGPLASCKLVYDRERNRHKGYGFIEYVHPESAVVAVQTFNNLSLRGRTLRAEFSQPGGSGGRDRGDRNGPGEHGYGRKRTDRTERSDRGEYGNERSDYRQEPRLQRNEYRQPSNRPVEAIPDTNIDSNGIPGNLIVDDTVSRNLSHLKPIQLLEVMTTLKPLVSQNPAQAHDVLRSNSNLVYSLVQALLLMGLVDATVVAQAVQGQIPQQQQQPAQPAAAQAPISYMQLSPPPPPPPPTGLGPQEAALVQQILGLTDDQINILPPDQRMTIRELRDRYRRGIYT